MEAARTGTEAQEARAPHAALTVRRTLRAPRERVFAAWTEPRHLTRWWGPPGWETVAVDVDLRPGGAYRIEMRRVEGGPQLFLSGTYREVSPPDRLVYTFTWDGETAPPDMKETLVTVAFLDRGGATEVVVTHELLPSDELRARHSAGWNGCLERLAALVESR